MPALRARVHPSPLSFHIVMTFIFWFQLLFMSGWFLNLDVKLKCLSWIPDIYCQVRLVSLKYGQRLLWSYHFLFGGLLISFGPNSFSYFCLQYFSNPSATLLCLKTALERGKSDHIMILLLVTYCYFLNKTWLSEPFMIKSLFTDWRPQSCCAILDSVLHQTQTYTHPALNLWTFAAVVFGWKLCITVCGKKENSSLSASN